MTVSRSRRWLLGAGIATLAAGALAGTALAHHGWEWADSELTELTGTIASITIAPPHPVIEVESEGETWTVELGNPSQTQRSGFVEGSAEVGQDIVVLGNRNADGSLHMKAVRITVEGQVFDIYPDRIPQ